MKTTFETGRLGELRVDASLDKPNGPAAAVLLAGGIACAVFGIIVFIAEGLSPAFLASLNWYKPVGPLAGKTDIEVIVFFGAWFILHLALRNKNVDFAKVGAASIVGLVIGILGTFPLVFNLFHG